MNTITRAELAMLCQKLEVGIPALVNQFVGPRLNNGDSIWFKQKSTKSNKRANNHRRIRPARSLCQITLILLPFFVCNHRCISLAHINKHRELIQRNQSQRFTNFSNLQSCDNHLILQRYIFISKCINIWRD